MINRTHRLSLTKLTSSPKIDDRVKLDSDDLFGGPNGKEGDQ